MTLYARNGKLHTGFFSWWGGGGGGESHFVHVCICPTTMRILVNKSQNNAVITNDVFLFAYVMCYIIVSRDGPDMPYHGVSRLYK